MRVPFMGAFRTALVILAFCLSLPLVVPTAAVQAPSTPDFDRQSRQQAETDKTWRAASQGHMTMEKITYRSRVGDLDIPAFVFQPMNVRGAKSHPALVWVHEDIRGHLYEHYIPFVREATAKGFIVIAPFGYNTGGWYGALGQGKDFKVGRVAPDAPDNLGELSEKDVLNVLEIARKEFNIDNKRVYLMGHSMGGGGSLYLGIKYSDNWAALAPMAPAIYSSPDDLAKIKHMPIIVVQGDKDTLVPVDSTRKWVAKMDELKMKHKYIEIPEGNHFQTITRNPKMIADVFDFLAKQKK